MNNYLYSEIKNISNKLDRIFYFVNPGNLILRKEAMERIANKFAKDLDIKVYGTRCGPNIQDPKNHNSHRIPTTHHLQIAS